MFNDKIWHKYVIFGRLACVLSKETRQHGLGLQSCIWTIHKTSRTMSSEQMRLKWRCLAIKYNTTLVKTTNTSHQMPHMLIGGWRFWACLVATGPGHLTVIESGMSSSVSKSILESNLGTSVRQLKLGQEWVMQRIMIPSTPANLQLNGWRKKRIKVLQQSSQGPDLILTQILWRELCRNQNVLKPQ